MYIYMYIGLTQAPRVPFTGWHGDHHCERPSAVSEDGWRGRGDKNRGARLDIHKRFVCLLEDCALVNTIHGIQHLHYCKPRPLNPSINIAQYMVPPPAPHPVFPFNIQYW